jgi:hypothetical protein
MIWNKEEFAKKMRKSRTPMSAFFLIDSEDAIEKCHYALAMLTGRSITQERDCEYFQRVHEIYREGRKVINFDHSFYIWWNNEKHELLLRVHSFDVNKYEAELQIPGFIAAALEEHFGRGDDGKFGCEFMPHSFYD